MDAGIAALVREVAGTAEGVRAAGALLSDAGALEWQGPSATRFRERLHGVQRTVTALAERVEDTAALLRAHESALAALTP